ncbi:MAG TPA: O-antigen ligase family protein, partial [Chloroflexota bacterium]|nr:O-antigen ligase family protein [Chloroflexota bacterium]
LILWSAKQPWVWSGYQDVLASLGELSLVLVASLGWLVARPRGRFDVDGARVRFAAAVLLVVTLAMSTLGAKWPPLAICRVFQVAIGFLASEAILRRPSLARALRVGFALVVIAEAPLVAVQIVTQSTFPTGTLLWGWPAEISAQTPGAFVVFGPDASRWQRAFGSFPHPNVLGGFLAITMLLTLPTERTSPRRRWLTAAGWIVGWGELFLTSSRTAMLATIFGGVLWLMSQKWPRRRSLGWLIGWVTALVALAAVPFGGILVGRLGPDALALNQPAVSDRLLLLRVAFELIARHPLTGIGGGGFPLALLDRPANVHTLEPVHVIPLLVAAEAGIIAGGAWLVLVLAIPIAQSLRKWRQGESVWSAWVIPAPLLLIASLDHYFWTLPTGIALFWLAVGIASSPAALRPPHLRQPARAATDLLLSTQLV